MKKLGGIDLANVQAVYGGPEGELWELIMGEQIHIGGFASSMDLADRAGVGPGMCGIDLCCCSGAGMRFLVRFRGVARMQGVDATGHVVELGRRRCRDEGLDDKIGFTLADVCETSLADGCADFVWGEDAWCYVEDKQKLAAEVLRLVRPGGTIAFTDWIEGAAGMTDDEAKRFMAFMKFPSLNDLSDYTAEFTDRGCDVVLAEDTGRFAPYADLYIEMLQTQLTYDALKVIGFDQTMMAGMAQEMAFMQDLARAGKLAQGRFVFRKPS